jgi:hypothetical protein
MHWSLVADGRDRDIAGGKKKDLPVDQPFKLLGDLDVQLDDTLIGLAFASILGSHRETTVFLRSVQNSKQLGFGIDHHDDAPCCLSSTTEPRDRFSATRRGRRQWRKARPERERAPVARSFGVAGAAGAPNIAATGERSMANFKSKNALDLHRYQASRNLS